MDLSVWSDNMVLQGERSDDLQGVKTKPFFTDAIKYTLKSVLIFEIRVLEASLPSLCM
jgi:hypothetical protein